MIVTVGGVSVRVTLIDGKTGRPADGVRLGPKSRLTPFTSRTAGRCLDLSVTRVGGSSWDAILTSGGLRADRTECARGTGAIPLHEGLIRRRRHAKKPGKARS